MGHHFTFSHQDCSTVEQSTNFLVSIQRCTIETSPKIRWWANASEIYGVAIVNFTVHISLVCYKSDTTQKNFVFSYLHNPKVQKLLHR